MGDLVDLVLLWLGVFVMVLGVAGILFITVVGCVMIYYGGGMQ